ncbi:MAG: glutathione synthase [Rhizobiales bacterium]|nr:glutathione synthase [Hyphomicrobiales bacterium]MBI3674388.1 glutathione synthase [Hyphomicrobiales bacterium]
MPLTIAVQMDPIETINIKGDSTFALMLEAQARGHALFYYQTRTLALEGGRLWATGQDVEVREVIGNHAALGELRRAELNGFDVVLMRQDPPFDMNYITVTHLLEAIHPKALVVNDPIEVRNAPEKLYVLRYRDFMPETLITRDPVELAAFRRAHGDIILKPLYGNGGAGVFRLSEGDQNFSALLELFGQAFHEPFIAQKYLPAVRAGDKRIILVDGKPAGAINRVPSISENRSNMHVGGRPEPAEMTRREHEICEAIGPDLRKRGLIFVGIDVIGGFLTEINVTSPTGIREIRRFGGADIASLIWDAIEARR